MAQLGRPGLSVEQKKDLWARWKAGESLSTIGRALGRRAGSIHGVLASRGGVVPRPRTRSSRVLTSAEREDISRGLAASRSLRSIAYELHRAPSTISREIARNAGRTTYRAVPADDRAWRQAGRPKRCRLATHAPLCVVVAAAKLGEDWSPAQIAGWLVTEYADDMTMRVSHETIYRSLYIQARGVLKRELIAHGSPGVPPRAWLTARFIRRVRASSSRIGTFFGSILRAAFQALDALKLSRLVRLLA